MKFPVIEPFKDGICFICGTACLPNYCLHEHCAYIQWEEKQRRRRVANEKL